MMDDDVIVRLLDLPVTVKGFVSSSSDGSYNVYLNAKHARDTQLKACEHEFRHIYNCDFDSDDPLPILEK